MIKRILSYINSLVVPEYFFKEVNFFSLKKYPFNSIELTFTIPNIKNLEDDKIINFLYLCNLYFFEKQKAPKIEDISRSMNDSYKIDTILTARNFESFDIFERIIHRLNFLSSLDKKTMLSVVYHSELHQLELIFKDFTFFDFLHDNTLSLPKIFCKMTINLDTRKDSVLTVEEIFNFFGLPLESLNLKKTK